MIFRDFPSLILNKIGFKSKTLVTLSMLLFLPIGKTAMPTTLESNACQTKTRTRSDSTTNLSQFSDESDFVMDSFEGSLNLALWCMDKIESDSWEIVTSPVWHGKNAIKITLKEGQKTYMGRDGNVTERSELQDRNVFALNSEIWLGFSVYIPHDFPKIDTRLIIAQLKQKCGKLTNCSPVVAIRLYENKWKITQSYDASEINTTFERRTVYQSPSAFSKGSWQRFVFHIKLTKSEEGFVHVWQNGKKIVKYQGRTAYFKAKDRFFFKLGLYRNHKQEPMSIYIDHYWRSYAQPSWLNL